MAAILSLALPLLAGLPAEAQPSNFEVRPDGEVRQRRDARLPVDPDCETRAVAEWSSWVGLGLGAGLNRARGDRGVLDAATGVETTFPISADNHVRLGPWMRLGTSTFQSFEPTGGLLLLVTSDTGPPWLDRYRIGNEGALGLRLGAGYAWRAGEVRSAPSAVVALTYGVRSYTGTIYGHNLYGFCESPAPGAPRPRLLQGYHGQDYAMGLRLYVSATTALDIPADWTFSVGVEIDPAATIQRFFQPFRVRRRYEREAKAAQRAAGRRLNLGQP
jgi:hypothetical protein